MINSCDILMMLMEWFERECRKAFRRAVVMLRHSHQEQGQIEWNK